MATRSTLRLSATFLLGTGGALLAICGPLMPGPLLWHLLMAGAGLVAISMGTMCGLVGHRLPRWCFDVMIAISIAVITLLAMATSDGLNAFAVTALFLLPVAAGAMQLALRNATVLIAIALACRGAATAASGATLGQILMVEGCTAGLALMVAWLAHVADIAEQDPLTGAYNRRGLQQRLEEVLRRLDREGGQCALIALDIDYFKQVNDAHGHSYGDRLLVGCAHAWRSVLPERAVIGRYGGDEFVVLLPDTSLGRAADLADRVRSVVPGETTASAGVAGWGYGDSQSLLLSRADVALYEAKSSGRDRTVVYGDPGREASEIEAAISAGEMRIALQPVVRLPEREIVGHEALIRWDRPGRGTVSPLDFIPQAERTGAIHAVGAWVLAESCRVAMALPGSRRSVAVNVSVHELRRSDYVIGVLAVLDEAKMPGELLLVEVTESVFEDDDPQIIANLAELRAHGAKVAIDDFGAGYSSLRRIEQLPIDIIKIDGALVSSIREDRDPAILRAIVTMAHSLGVELIAEYVETPYQAQVLEQLGYDMVQGYLFGRPLDPEQTLVATLKLPVEEPLITAPVRP